MIDKDSAASALPVALPVAPLSEPTNPQVSALSHQSSETEMPQSATVATPPTRRRQTGSRQLARLRESLSERDLSIIDLVSAHRYLTTPQIERFCFIDHATPVSAARSARRVLRRLCDSGLLQTLKRRVGGARMGSASYVWRLGPVGYRLLQENGQLKRTYEPSTRFLDHSLAVADAHLAVLAAQRLGDYEHVAVQTEPTCWRPYTGLGGERRVLQPDLFFTTEQAEYVDHWFCEIDLGSESIKTVLGKCYQYEEYRRSGTEQATSGIFPLVIWQFPTKERLDKVAQVIARSSRLVPGLFRLVLPDGLAPLVIGGAA